MLLDRVARSRLTTNFTRRGRTHGHQGVAVRDLRQSAAAGTQALRTPRRRAALLVVRPRFPLAVDAAVRHAFALRAPQHPPAGLLAVATEEHLLFWRRLLRCRWCVVLREPPYGHLDAGYVYCGLLLHLGSRVDGVFWAASMQALFHDLCAANFYSFGCLRLRGQRAPIERLL